MSFKKSFHKEIGNVKLNRCSLLCRASQHLLFSQSNFSLNFVGASLRLPIFIKLNVIIFSVSSAQDVDGISCFSVGLCMYILALFLVGQVLGKYVKIIGQLLEKASLLVLVMLCSICGPIIVAAPAHQWEVVSPLH